ncbi:MAG: ribose-phosphate pyrophosphokinase [Eubacteriales bacterium]|jgi:ribose-phosphate pyrophosphokinase|nr:ribose-phosphate pyrophosphokinase [Eubacteriales bacterium]
MFSHEKEMKIFAANSNIPLAKEIAAELGMSLGLSEVGRFSDGEIEVAIKETVRGCDVFIVQSTSFPVNENIMELLIMIDAFRRASAGRITAVIPYFGYARQDRKAKARDPISAKLVANIITIAGADRILTMDLHAPQLQGFFDIPVDHLSGVAILAPYYLDMLSDCFENVTIISPDFGSVNRARTFSRISGAPIAIIDKKRPRPGESEVCNIIGDVRNRICILVDDMIDTAGTICNAAQALIDSGGAKSVYACATHGVLSGEAVSRLNHSVIEEVVLLDTIEIPSVKQISKIKILHTSSVFAETIQRIYENLPVSTMFNRY